MALIQLQTKALDKVWGTPDTEPWYQNPTRNKIGEVWFGASGQVPLLVKFLFTSDNLSVQVHPNDEYARQHHQSKGKTEMWHVLRAEPDAKIAVSLKETITPQRLREASLSGEIMDLLNWINVHPGETYYIPAGTIHALGGGLVVCEVQQYSDVTYRLYDYGRPRELHLDDSIAVSNLNPYDARQTPKQMGAGRQLLASSPYFRTERVDVQGSTTLPVPTEPTMYIVLNGQGTIGGEPFTTGHAFEAMPDVGPLDVISESAALLVTSVP